MGVNQATGNTIVEVSASVVLASKSETVAVSTSAIGLTAANYAGATSAVIQVQDDTIRFWADGTTPTPTAGILALSGDTIELTSAAEIAAFRAIRASTSSMTAHLAATYFG